jgi:hypothetical protein
LRRWDYPARPPYQPSDPRPGFRFVASDPDSQISGLTVDCGDGSTPTRLTEADDLTPRRNNGGSWYVAAGRSRAVFQPRHHYDHAGAYTITATVRSGTGTRNPQSRTLTRSYEVSARDQQPRP